MWEPLFAVTTTSVPNVTTDTTAENTTDTTVATGTTLGGTTHTDQPPEDNGTQEGFGRSERTLLVATGVLLVLLVVVAIILVILLIRRHRQPPGGMAPTYPSAGRKPDPADPRQAADRARSARGVSRDGRGRRLVRARLGGGASAPGALGCNSGPRKSVSPEWPSAIERHVTRNWDRGSQVLPASATSTECAPWCVVPRECRGRLSGRLRR